MAAFKIAKCDLETGLEHQVSAAGLTWDDCHDYLHRLGYEVKAELLEAKQQPKEGH